MVALDLGFIQIYRYGIFYAISFIIGYFLLKYLAKYIYTHYTSEIKTVNLYQQIYNDIDDIIVYVAIGVIVGGRLGEVLIYNFTYYMQEPLKIFALQDGGMSFVGGFLGVMMAIFYYQYKKKFSFDEILAVFDLIVLILPLGIVLGRFGNYLNQELAGQTISYIYQKYSLTSVFGEATNFANKCLDREFCRIYSRIDDEIRLNTNLLEALLEGVVTGLVGIYIWVKSYRQNIKPGQITGTFMIIYSIGRGLMENFRDNPPNEYIYGILKSQLWMVGFCLFGIWLLFNKKIIYSKAKK